MLLAAIFNVYLFFNSPSVTTTKWKEGRRKIRNLTKWKFMTDEIEMYYYSKTIINLKMKTDESVPVRELKRKV